jgi:predicted dinucleotide-binding enzyme
MTSIAVLGAGHVGPVIARIAVEAGFHVTISASGDPAKIALITEILVPGAQARWAADAVEDADLVVLAIPLHKFATFDPALVAGKLVVDPMNYWPPTDGVQPMFEDHRYSSSETVQRRLALSTVVKTFNHLGYHQLEEERRPEGERVALGIAGEDTALVAEVVDRIGFDPVQLGGLSAGRILEPGGPVFGAPLGRAEFERVLEKDLSWQTNSR